MGKKKVEKTLLLGECSRQWIRSQRCLMSFVTAEKPRWSRDADVGTWAEEETAVVFWPETQKRRGKYLHFNATNNGYVNTHTGRLKPCSIAAGLLGLLQCDLTSGNSRVKISNNQKNLEQVGWAKRLRCKWSLRDHQNTMQHRRKKKCPTDSFSTYK